MLPWAYQLPINLLRLICKILAIPIFVGGIIVGKPHSFGEVNFKLFDHLNPHYRTVHSDKEVIDWFEKAGFKDIEVKISQNTGGVGVFGIKK